MHLLPQFLDIRGNSREAVDAIHHTVFLDELGAALEDLGHYKDRNSVSSHNTVVNICAVFT